MTKEQEAHHVSMPAADEPASSVVGTWDLSVKTPIGRQQATLELTERDGTLEGVARSGQETVPLVDLVLRGDTLTWRQSITRPMRLHLEFELIVDGDTMAGSSKAGRLPSSKVVATRVGGR